LLVQAADRFGLTGAGVAALGGVRSWRDHNPGGWLLTDADDDIVALDRRHRARARIEDRIRCAKTLGLRNLPCGDFDRNAVWVALVLTAADLICWTQALCLTGDLAKAEPD